MGVEDNFHLTGKKQHLDMTSGAAGTATPLSTSPLGKTPRKKGMLIVFDFSAKPKVIL